MIQKIYKYVDKLFSIVKPQKLFMMAIDGMLVDGIRISMHSFAVPLSVDWGVRAFESCKALEPLLGYLSLTIRPLSFVVCQAYAVSSLFRGGGSVVRK